MGGAGFRAQSTDLRCKQPVVQPTVDRKVDGLPGKLQSMIPAGRGTQYLWRRALTVARQGTHKVRGVTDATVSPVVHPEGAGYVRTFACSFLSTKSTKAQASKFFVKATQRARWLHQRGVPASIRKHLAPLLRR